MSCGCDFEARHLCTGHETFVREQRMEDFRNLASAMRKVLPAPLLDQVIAHLDPMNDFIRVLRKMA
jgi:hypothetical protein